MKKELIAIGLLLTILTGCQEGASSGGGEAAVGGSSAKPQLTLNDFLPEGDEDEVQPTPTPTPMASQDPVAPQVYALGLRTMQLEGQTFTVDLAHWKASSLIARQQPRPAFQSSGEKYFYGTNTCRTIYPANQSSNQYYNFDNFIDLDVNVYQVRIDSYNTQTGNPSPCLLLYGDYVLTVTGDGLFDATMERL